MENKEFIDQWIVKYHMLDRIKLYQKFEWNCGTDVTDIHDAVIQVRQSGIRVKRPTYYPALVAIVNTPIIFDKKKKHFRYITPREAANLQNFDKRFKFVGTDKQIYRQLGNSVNVIILKKLGKKLFSFEKTVEGIGEKMDEKKVREAIKEFEIEKQTCEDMISYCKHFEPKNVCGRYEEKELKKCPFCGGEAILEVYYGFNKEVIFSYVYCRECGVSTRSYALEKTAQEAWNRRVE